MRNIYRFILCCLLLGSFSVAFGQTWQRTYGGKSDDFGYDVEQTKDSGYILTGSTYSVIGGQDIYLIRTDANGDTLWTKTYGGAGSDAGYSVKQTADSGFIVAGETTSFNGGIQKIYLVRTNSNGDTLWTKTYGNGQTEFSGSLIISADGGFCIAGSTGSVGSGLSNVYIIKTDANGDTAWTKSIKKSSNNFAYSLQQAKDGGYIISGALLNTASSHYEDYLVKVNANGDTLWTKTFAGSGDSYGNSVIQSDDDGYVVGGYTNGDYYIVKTDSLGNQQWSNIINEGGDDRASSVIESDGGYILAGYSLNFNNADGILQKVDLNGNPLWVKRFGGANWDDFSAIQPVAGGGLIIVGSTQSYGAGGSDVWLVKTDCINYPMDSIFTNDTTFFCRGVDSVTVAMRSPISSGLQYQWQRNDIDISGATSASYTADSAGTYRLIVADMAGCSNPSSDSITVYVSSMSLKPVITQNGDTLRTEDFFGSFQWYLNDTLIPGATGFTYIATRLGKYKVAYSVTGCPSFSNELNVTLLGIENINNGIRVNISPNPFSTYTRLTITNESGLPVSNLQFELFDMLGRAVLQADIKNDKYEIERNSLAAGLYFYRVKQSAGILANGKLVIQ